MTEADLKDQLVAHLRAEFRGAVILRHEDKGTAGIPDLSFTWLGKTTWIEAKFANPYVRGKGLQDLICMRLAAAGNCWYVVWEVKQGVKRTLIVHPKDIQAGQLENTPDERMNVGFDHRLVASFLRRQHDYHGQVRIYSGTRNVSHQTSPKETSS